MNRHKKQCYTATIVKKKKNIEEGEKKEYLASALKSLETIQSCAATIKACRKKEY